MKYECDQQDFWSQETYRYRRLLTETIQSLRNVISRSVNRRRYFRLRGTKRRAMSVEILSTAAELYEKSHLKWHAVCE